MELITVLVAFGESLTAEEHANLDMSWTVTLSSITTMKML